MGNELAVSGGGMMNVFSNSESFNLALRMANGLAESTIIPKQFQRNVGNCMIAVEMAARLNMSPMMVMQNLYIVNGNPAWSSQWIIAMINKSGRYTTELQFEFGHDDADGGLSCLAWAPDKNGRRVEGPKITMKMAQAEGWLGKTGSKWKTMPEVMIRYRAASFFGRANCPDLLMGIYSQEEVIDMGPQMANDMSGLIANPATGEVLNLAPPSEDPEITQDQRTALLKMVQNNFGDAGQTVLNKLLAEEGCDNTHNLKKSAYDRIIKKVFDPALKAQIEGNGNEADDAGAPETPEPSDEPEDDGGTLPWREDGQQTIGQ